MDEVLHANIFFVIASIATVIFCIILGFVLYQVYRVIKVIRSIVERVEAASEVVAQDISDVRTSIKQGGFVSKIIGFIIGAAGAKKTRRK